MENEMKRSKQLNMVQTIIIAFASFIIAITVVVIVVIPAWIVSTTPAPSEDISVQAPLITNKGLLTVTRLAMKITLRILVYFGDKT